MKAIPRAFMDRSVIEGDPHSIIEGMILAAYAIGAQKGYVYIRAEYPIAVERLEHAIDEARSYGLWVNALFGTDFLSILKSGLAPALLSAAKKPHSCPPSKEGAGN